ncbi:MAG: hypothetical protein COB37_08570 [Kordiimonadales bacterium]|nr:MAG: hypothetical protein COB37_08570 [Kordiimonadales bacterium]
MNIYKALVKREILEGKNGFIRVPLILSAIALAFLIFSAIGFGNVIYIDGMEREGIENVGDAVSILQEKEPEGLPLAVTMMYWFTTSLPWVALPFVIFFSLLGSLYEERRDRSILFWKSMPIADWQEVLIKLFVPIFIAPLIFLGVIIAAQLAVAIFMTIVVLFQGGPALEMLPLGYMITTWFAFLGHYLLGMLWMLPFLAWLLLVSAFSGRMPFLWAILPPGILVAIEGIFFKSASIAKWISIHLGGWRIMLEDKLGQVNPDTPREVFDIIVSGSLAASLSVTFSSIYFWTGLVIAAAFVYAAIEMRKRAI